MIVQEAWSADTSSDPEWTPGNPALGQCAVTALVIQDLLGGDLLRTINCGASHYWNRLPDGSHLDLTREQFDVWLPEEVTIRDREYVLSFPATAERYGRLKERLA